MQEIEIPSGVKVQLSKDRDELTISGKLGSCTKRINTHLLQVSVDGSRLVIKEADSKKLAKKAALAAQALGSEAKSAMRGVESGYERRMKILFAHFPITVEVKDGTVQAKNMFGEKKPRVARIIGDTKVEVKQQDLTVRGVDVYDVGQTAANIHKLSFAKHKDSRVFQDGIYYESEE
jgi:large subunit ribosomal protein L6